MQGQAGPHVQLQPQEQPWELVVLSVIFVLAPVQVVEPSFSWPHTC